MVKNGCASISDHLKSRQPLQMLPRMVIFSNGGDGTMDINSEVRVIPLTESPARTTQPLFQETPMVPMRFTIIQLPAIIGARGVFLQIHGAEFRLQTSVPLPE